MVRGPHILNGPNGQQDSCGGPNVCEFCIKGHAPSVHPSNCTRTHWGIADCEECGLKWSEQGDFPVVVPERYDGVPVQCPR